MKSCAVVSGLILLVLVLGGCAVLMVAAMSVPPGTAVNTPAPEPGCETVERGKVCIGDISNEGGAVALVVQVENHDGRNLIIDREQIALRMADGRTVAHDPAKSLETWGEFGALDLAPNARGSIGVVFAVTAGDTVEAVVYSGFGEDVIMPLASPPNSP